MGWPGPPDDVEAADLFHTLLQAPRPSWPIEVRGGAFVVSALTRLERASVEAAIARAPGPAQALARMRHEVAAALRQRDGTAPFTAEQAGGMTRVALAGYHEAVTKALHICGPEYGRSDAKAWSERLKQGARQMAALAWSVGGCIDEGWRRITERPDRWFGCPLKDLTDGHWMAYRAAVSVYLEMMKRESK